MNIWLAELIVRYTHRVPAPQGPSGDGATAARRFDAALMSAGFKLSRDLMAELSGLSEDTVVGVARRTLPVVREMAGDHVRHNVYFRDFPRNVPETMDFACPGAGRFGGPHQYGRELLSCLAEGCARARECLTTGRPRSRSGERLAWYSKARASLTSASYPAASAR